MVKKIESSQHIGVPRQIGWVMYVATVMAARLRLNTRIGNSPDESLRGWIEWALTEPWVDSSLRPLFEEAKQQFSKS